MNDNPWHDMKTLTILLGIWMVLLNDFAGADTASGELNQYKFVNGEDTKGIFIDIGLGDRVFARFSAISDSGIEVERVVKEKVVWRAFCKPLGVDHSIYSQQVEMKISGKHILVVSRGSGGTFTEKRNISDGKLVKRSAG